MQLVLEKRSCAHYSLFLQKYLYPTYLAVEMKRLGKFYQLYAVKPVAQLLIR